MYAEIVSTGAALAAAGSLFLHWMRWQEDRRAKALVVKMKITGPLEGAPAWHSLQITMRSRSNLGYSGESLRVLWPPSGRVVTGESMFTQDGLGSYTVVNVPEKPKRRVEPALSVSHSGKQRSPQSWGGYVSGSGDEDSTVVYVTRRGKGRMLVSMEVKAEDASSFATYRRWLRIA